MYIAALYKNNNPGTTGFRHHKHLKLIFIINLKGHVKSIYQYDEKILFHSRSPYFLQVICLKNNNTTLYMS